MRLGMRPPLRHLWRPMRLGKRPPMRHLWRPMRHLRRPMRHLWRPMDLFIFMVQFVGHLIFMVTCARLMADLLIIMAQSVGHLLFIVKCARPMAKVDSMDLVIFMAESVGHFIIMMAATSGHRKKPGTPPLASRARVRPAPGPPEVSARGLWAASPLLSRRKMPRHVLHMTPAVLSR